MGKKTFGPPPTEQDYNSSNGQKKQYDPDLGALWTNRDKGYIKGSLNVDEICI